MSNNIKGRHPLVVKLKSGEYDGADIMAAWILIEELQAQLDRITEIIGMDDGGRICQNDAYYRIVELMENK